jgi:phage gp45-like
MHRTSPANAAFRSYVAGGARHCVDQVDDQSTMQSSGGGFMANEKRKNIEAPQNYGFTSVAHKKDDNGGSAESFVQYLGGNRSLPVLQNMDDRRHRLNKLDEGDSAMYRGKTDYQQFHMTTDGGFWSAPQDKTVRMALVQQNSGQQQQQQGGQGGNQPSQRDGSGGGGGSGGGSGGQSGQGGQNKPTGQQSVKKDNQSSKQFMHITKDEAASSGTNVRHYLDDGNGYYEVNSDKNVYAGALKGKGKFAKVVTTSGPTKNVLGNLG